MIRRIPTRQVIVLLCSLGASSSAGARETSCHIHPPGSSPENPVGTIGPFASAAECETERVRRLGAQGRCHCRADFTPRWLPREQPGPATRDPAGLL